MWLKKRADYNARNVVQSHAFITRVEVSPGKFDTDPMAVAKYIASRTFMMIHDWTVTDESGRRVPVSMEALGALDPEDGEFLEVEARRRYEGAPKDRPLDSNSDNSSAMESNSPTPRPSESPTSES